MHITHMYMNEPIDQMRFSLNVALCIAISDTFITHLQRGFIKVDDFAQWVHCIRVTQYLLG
mgnify:CR=1 FL=1